MAAVAESTAKAAVEESREEVKAVAEVKSAGARAQPVTAAEASAQGPALVPGTAAAASADSIDYSVASNGSIIVAAAETLGHYADWLGLPAARLRALNGLKMRTPVVMGRRLKLEFPRATREQFEQRRREYHQRLQAEYFAMHRIVGTEIYLARRGDSLWSVTQRGQLPVWLLQQYNPDLDFSNLRPGTQIVLPRVEGTV
jgi:membrane-bound lytic murein transglycosylase D